MEDGRGGGRPGPGRPFRSALGAGVEPPGRLLCLAAAVALAGSACGRAPVASPLAEEERRAVREVADAYVEAWRSGDPDGVLATLAPDAVLMPPGADPVQGTEAIRSFWWPDDGSTTTITGYDVTIEEVGGSGRVAWTRGRAELAWVYEKDGERSEAENRSRSLTVYRRGPEGRWRIARRMWVSAP